MTDLECRALMGDKQAQEECTRKGIVLPCPCCSSEDISYRTSEGDYDYGCGGFRCWNCDLGQGYEFNTREEALAKWNTRPAPPVGRCGECAAYVDSKCANTGYYKSETGFCDDFAPKEGEENG